MVGVAEFGLIKHILQNYFQIFIRLSAISFLITNSVPGIYT